jgi:hypothetical protein
VTIDQAAYTLHRLGWTVGTYWVLDIVDGPLCVVEAEQGNHLIRARAEQSYNTWSSVAEVATEISLEVSVSSDPG